MTKVVTDETLGRVARQQHDLFRRVRDGTLDPGEISRGLQALIEGRDGTSPVFSRDMTKEGWELVEGSDEPDPALLSTTEFEFVPILKKDEGSISGAEMRKRALLENANLGQRAAEWWLAHPKKMPVRPEGVYWIPFTRTVWRYRDGGLGVPCLDWHGGRWILGFNWLEGEWDSRGRFLRPRK
ncbi:MAG: hypothetical protein HYS60_02125 [Candidatus Wildermuthbacteria bacterium]|nr:hypothetical protein [Candidatus Wildermuthbacteria bacterium]